MLKEEQSVVIQKFINSSNFHLHGTHIKNPEWVDEKNIESAISKYEGMSSEIRNTVKTLSKTSKGVWTYEKRPASYYNKYYNKSIIIIGDTEITVVSSYNGCWTMSGEDYVPGKTVIHTYPMID